MEFIGVLLLSLFSSTYFTKGCYAGSAVGASMITGWDIGFLRVSSGYSCGCTSDTVYLIAGIVRFSNICGITLINPCGIFNYSLVCSITLRT